MISVRRQYLVSCGIINWHILSLFFDMKPKYLFALAIPMLLVAAISCNPGDEQKVDILEIGSEVEIKGLIACLPKKGEGPFTLECAFGLKVDSAYYGLKNIPRRSIKNSVVRTGNIVKIYGTVIEAKADTLYDIAASIDINKIELVKKDTAKGRYFKGDKFKISIPPSWVMGERADASWSMISSQTDGTVLGVFKTSEEYLDNTNFGYAKITVGTSDDPVAVANCVQPLENRKRLEQAEVEINGETFTKISITDAGAGNRYVTNSYRITRNGKCWAVESVMNYSPIEFYGNESGVTEFNRAKTEQMIQNIIQTFKFKQ